MDRGYNRLVWILAGTGNTDFAEGADFHGNDFVVVAGWAGGRWWNEMQWSDGAGKYNYYHGNERWMIGEEMDYGDYLEPPIPEDIRRTYFKTTTIEAFITSIFWRHPSTVFFSFG